MRRTWCLAAAVCLACGAGWHAVPVAEPLAPRQQVQLWIAGHPTRVHAVEFGPDTIWAVPYLEPPSCTGCRRAYPRAAVDSVRVGNPVGGFWRTVGLVAGVPVGLLVVMCAADACPGRT